MMIQYVISKKSSYRNEYHNVVCTYLGTCTQNGQKLELLQRTKVLYSENTDKFSESRVPNTETEGFKKY